MSVSYRSESMASFFLCTHFGTPPDTPPAKNLSFLNPASFGSHGSLPGAWAACQPSLSALESGFLGGGASGRGSLAEWVGREKDATVFFPGRPLIPFFLYDAGGGQTGMSAESECCRGFWPVGWTLASSGSKLRIFLTTLRWKWFRYGSACEEEDGLECKDLVDDEGPGRRRREDELVEVEAPGSTERAHRVDSILHRGRRRGGE